MAKTKTDRKSHLDKAIKKSTLLYLIHTWWITKNLWSCVIGAKDTAGKKNGAKR
jgi:hypothetical protein